MPPLRRARLRRVQVARIAGGAVTFNDGTDATAPPGPVRAAMLAAKREAAMRDIDLTDHGQGWRITGDHPPSPEWRPIEILPPEEAPA